MEYYIRLIAKLLVVIITLLIFYKKLIKKHSVKKEDFSRTARDEEEFTGKQQFPFLVEIIKGEGRILVIPWLQHLYGYQIQSTYAINISEISDSNAIGKAIFEAVDYIKQSSLSRLTPQEREENAIWKKNSRYKSFKSFCKNNNEVVIYLGEDSCCIIHAMSKNKNSSAVINEILLPNAVRVNKNPSTVINEILLPKGASIEDIVNAVLKSFEILEKYYSENKEKNTDEMIKNIELLNGSTLCFQVPADEHFIDSEDFGVMEIYQGYSYIVNETSNSSAEIFLGIAAELDCNLKSDNIKNIWQEFDGKAEYFEVKDVNFGIFKLKAEFKNKNIHRISYFLKIDESELLECALQVHQPNRRKKSDEKLVKIFEDFALSCKR